MNLNSINFKVKFAAFDELWTPKCAARFDNYLVKLGKIKGEYIWHSHEGADEIFIVHKGGMKIELRTGTVCLSEGEMYVVGRGVEHKPVAAELCEIIMIERDDVLNTGNKKNEYTKEKLDWI